MLLCDGALRQTVIDWTERYAARCTMHVNVGLFTWQQINANTRRKGFECNSTTRTLHPNPPTHVRRGRKSRSGDGASCRGSMNGRG
eukprot:365128-Chlamydomonas_euryale.AAC.3